MEMIYFLTDQLKIETHPLNTTVGENQDVNFTVAASGIKSSSGRFTYTWHRDKNAQTEAKSFGINSATLLLKNVIEADEGSYYCVVTNEWNHMVTSYIGVLEVICK